MRYLEHWEQARDKAKREVDLAAAAQASTTQSGPEPKDRDSLTAATQEPTVPLFASQPEHEEGLAATLQEPTEKFRP